MSFLHTVSDSISFEIEFTAPYKTFEQGLDLGVHKRYSPSLRSSMSGHDTASLEQTDRPTFDKRTPIQSIMYCML